METNQTNNSCNQPSIFRHVVAIPFPGRGHVNPMLSLCHSLLQSHSNLLISIILTEEWARLVSLPSHPNLRLATISNVLPSEAERGFRYAEFVEAVLTLMGGPVDKAIEEMDPAVDLLIADLLLPWVPEIGRRRRVNVAAFWPQSASAFLALLQFKRAESGETESNDKAKDALRYLPRGSSTHLLDFSKSKGMHSKFLQVISWYPFSQALLFNSFNDIEPQSLQTLASEISVPIYPIGPLLPLPLITLGNSYPDYLKWLNKYPENSVLYVSLGSFLSLSDNELKELTLGLMLSGHPFIWAIHGTSSLRVVNESLKGYDKGLIVPWCDQYTVLSHRSIGGFLTHCGWNSTLEALKCGLPMIVYPLMWDQYPNAKMVVEDWRVGLSVKSSGEDDVLKREEIASVVRKLMDFDACERKEIIEKVKEMKEKFAVVLETENGGSRLAVKCIVQDLIMHGDNVSRKR
ncbi:UDP-glycosyltransferase 87A2-like isoform X1 [Carex littledalei]|uniref:Glycosyltransferase n=1 Tax=Carex littledalei TaxID=544730 RepID=A0A833QKM3_9POAL|nr:UDP-glycosyltransferase 87A2-like isoform X1 [Carex littledalei]